MLTAFQQQKPSALTLTPTQLFALYSQKMHSGPPLALINELKTLSHLFYGAYVGGNSENAMDLNEIRKSVFIFEKLEEHYGKLSEQRGVDAIINEIIEHLLGKLGGSERAFDPNDSQEKWVDKTALRALLDPAPEGSEHPNFLLASTEEVYGAGKKFHARKMLSIFWLAATDPNIETEAGLEKKVVNEWEKSEVIRLLADIRRANNKTQLQLPEPIDIIDKVSCAPGLINRIASMFNYNLMLRKIKESLLSLLDEFQLRFNTFIISRFKVLSPLTQMQIIYSYYYQVINDEEDETNPAFKDFFNNLLSEEVAVEFLEMLQAEFGPFQENLFKAALVTFFEKWLKNRHKMPTDLLYRLEQISQASQVKYLYDSVLNESDDAVFHVSEKLENILSQMKILKKQLSPLQYLEKQQLLSQQQNYVMLYQQLQQIVDELIVTNKTRFDSLVCEAETIFARKTGRKPSFSIKSQAGQFDWLPLWIKKYQATMNSLHREITEALTDHLFRLESPDPDLFPNQPTMLFSFSPDLIPHEEKKLVKTHLYRHAANPERLNLQGVLSPHCSIQIFGVTNEMVQILFINLEEVTNPLRYNMPLEYFKSLAKAEQAYIRSLNHPLDILRSQFSSLQKSKGHAKFYLDQLQLAFIQSPSLFDKALSLQTKTSLQGILASGLSADLSVMIQSKLVQQDDNITSAEVSDDLERSLRSLYITRPKIG